LKINIVYTVTLKMTEALLIGPETQTQVNFRAAAPRQLRNSARARIPDMTTPLTNTGVSLLIRTEESKVCGVSSSHAMPKRRHGWAIRDFKQNKIYIQDECLI